MSQFQSSGPGQSFSRNRTGGVPRLGEDYSLNAPGITARTVESYAQGLDDAEALGRILGLTGQAASEIGQAYRLQGYIATQQQAETEQQQALRARAAAIQKHASEGFGVQSAQEKSPILIGRIGESTSVLGDDEIDSAVNSAIAAETSGLDTVAAQAYVDHAKPRLVAAYVSRNAQLREQARADATDNILASAPNIADAAGFAEKVDALAAANPGTDRAVLERKVGERMIAYSAIDGDRAGFDRAISLAPSVDPVFVEQQRYKFTIQENAKQAEASQAFDDAFSQKIIDARDGKRSFDSIEPELRQEWGSKVNPEKLRTTLGQIDTIKHQQDVELRRQLNDQFKQTYIADKKNEVGLLMDSGRPVPDSYSFDLPDGTSHEINTKPIVQTHLNNVLTGLQQQYPTDTGNPASDNANKAIVNVKFADYMGKLPGVKYAPWEDLLSSGSANAVNAAGEPSPQAMAGAVLFRTIEQSQNPEVATRHAGNSTPFYRGVDLLLNVGKGPDGGGVTLPEATAAAASVVRIGANPPSLDAKPIKAAVQDVAESIGAENTAELGSAFVRQCAVYAALRGLDPTSEVVIDRVSKDMKADYATVDGRAFFSRGIESLHNDFQPIADAMKEINKGRGMFKYDATSRTATLTSDMGLPLDGAPALTTADMHAISANIRQHKFISGYGGRAAEQKALRARLDKNVDRMSDTARAVYNVMAAQTPTSDYMSTTGGIAP